MADLLLIVVLLMIGLSLFGLVAFFVLRRWSRALVLIVDRDLRNPNLQPQKYYAVYDAKEKYIALYRNLLQPFITKIIPPFEMRSYVFDKRVHCLIGVSGNPEDDNFVAVHYPVVGLAGAREFAKETSGAFLKALNDMDIAKNYRLDDEVDYIDLKKDKVSGKITNIDYHGIAITFDDPYRGTKPLSVGISTLVYDDFKVSDKATKLPIGIVVPYSATKHVINNTSHNKPSRLQDYAELFFNPDWIMQTFGIVPVDDANLVLANAKTAVSSFNSKIIARADAKMSWAARNQVVIGFAIVAIILCVSLAIVYNVTATYVNGLGAQTSSVLAKIEAQTGISVVAPTTTTTTTTIPTTASGSGTPA